MFGGNPQARGSNPLRSTNLMVSEMTSIEYILEVLSLFDFFQAMEGAEISDLSFLDEIQRLSDRCTKCDIRSVSLKQLRLRSRRSLTENIFNRIRYSARLKVTIEDRSFTFDLRRIEYSELQKQLKRFDGS